jgi:hypothetical protein
VLEVIVSVGNQRVIRAYGCVTKQNALIYENKEAVPGKGDVFQL